LMMNDNQYQLMNHKYVYPMSLSIFIYKKGFELNFTYCKS
jgi:hypothetical protein